MGEALFYGALGASSLVVGAILALWLKPSHKVIGLILAFGAGALISAVAFELVLDPLDAGRTTELGIGMGLGAFAFFLGDLLIDRSGGSDRRKMARAEGEGNTLALFLGVLLDGIPESFILGMTILTEGSVGWAFLAAVFMSNLPEGMATTSGFRRAGWPVPKIEPSVAERGCGVGSFGRARLQALRGHVAELPGCTSRASRPGRSSPCWPTR